MPGGEQAQPVGARGFEHAPGPGRQRRQQGRIARGRLVPALHPARQVGVHEVQYAMVIILSMGIGLFAPPFGVGYYSACAVGRIDPSEGIRPLMGYLVALVLGVVLIALVPWFSIGFL